MKVLETPISPFQQNAPVVFCEKTNQCIFVDPGDEVEKIIASIEKLDLKPISIVLTHGHIDHAGAALKLSNLMNLEIIGPHKDDKFLLDSLETQGQIFGIQSKCFKPKRWLGEGDLILLGDDVLEVYHCPGHTPGHIILVSHKSKIIIAGDVIFKGSIGRTDFPRGNHKQLLESIKCKVLSCNDDYSIYSGHGPVTSVGLERKTNPFLLDA